MSSLDDFASEKLVQLQRRSLLRTLVETERTEDIWAVRNGRRLLSFSCNDYLNLSHHPAIKAAAKQAVERYGVGSGASRLVTGNHPLFTDTALSEPVEAFIAREVGRRGAVSSLTV